MIARPLLKKLLNSAQIEPYLRVCLKRNSALHRLGWFRSALENSAVDAVGRPIPWLTYPIINFLDKRLSAEHCLFEYGAGNSTVWFASKTRSVIALEHTNEWAEGVRPRLPPNAQLHVRAAADSRHYDEIAFLELELENAYTQFILESNAQYDIIVIDGIYRNACTRTALQRLLPGGVLVLDNTDFAAFSPAVETLHRVGFRGIDFAGMCPITQKLSQSSIFYRTQNCLGI